MTPANEDVTKPDRDMSRGHPLLVKRWAGLQELLEADGFRMFVNEVFRPERRQQWLYGAGRMAPELLRRGIPGDYARPAEPVVTNAWSCATSAHGWHEGGVPAAAALDVVPTGADGKPWNRDDPWDAFVARIATLGPECGLVHFHSPGKAVWDRPHLQLVEWSDRRRGLFL